MENLIFKLDSFEQFCLNRDTYISVYQIKIIHFFKITKLSGFFTEIKEIIAFLADDRYIILLCL
jgi:hypothetical protein